MEQWTESELRKLDIDEVFSPYIIGMIDDSEEMHESIHEVLMGWVPLELEQKAHEFVRKLIHFSKNPQEIPSNSSSVDDSLPKHLSYFEDSLAMSTEKLAPRDEMESAMESTAASVLVDTFSEPFTLELHEASLSPGSRDLEEADFELSVGQELIDQLSYRFPEASPDSLLEILKNVNMDVNAAIQVVKSILEKESSGITQVCRHYLQGECRRADCMFLHDTQYITCRFWLRGHCTQSEQCIFSHGVHVKLEDLTYDSDFDNEHDDVQMELPPDIASQDKFPALGETIEEHHEPAVATTQKTVEQITTELGLDFAKALRMAPAVSTNDKAERCAMNRNALRTSSVQKLRSSAHFGNKWLSTGESVKHQYKTLRADAAVLARARNDCFMNATLCFRGGNKARATELSRKGREYNAQMKELHLMAATEIFKARNPPEQLYKHQILDLHGLHVAEAIEFLIEMLPQLANEGLQTIRIVTGTGHHSSGPQGKARLRPAVERFLQSEEYQYSEVPDQRGHVGMILVQIVW